MTSINMVIYYVDEHSTASNDSTLRTAGEYIYVFSFSSDGRRTISKVVRWFGCTEY